MPSLPRPLAAPLAILLVAGIVWWLSRDDEQATPEEGRLEAIAADGYAWLRVPLARVAEVEGLPVRVTREGRTIRCRRSDAGARILVETFQRRAEEAAYGVYALWLEKSDLPLDPPLEGDPIGWPDTDHAEALARQMSTSGLDAARARTAVRGHAEAWFEDGLRVFLVLPREAAESVAAFAALPQGPDGPHLLLVVLDLEG